MTTHKRKKVIKYRGSKTHGCGSMKKRRGAGHRGGRGNAGTGKKGDAKKPSINVSNYFGGHGFKNHSVVREINPINLGYIEENLEAGKIDLGQLGYNKLLGSGRLTKKVVLTVEAASKKAIDKVKKLGGEVILPKKEGSAIEAVAEEQKE